MAATIEATIAMPAGYGNQEIDVYELLNQAWATRRTTAHVHIIDTSTNTMSHTVTTTHNYLLGCVVDDTQGDCLVMADRLERFDCSNYNHDESALWTRGYGVSIDESNQKYYAAYRYNTKGCCKFDASLNKVGDVTSGDQAGNGDAMGCAYDADHGKIFTSHTVADCISVIHEESFTLSATISVGDTPYGICYDSETGKLFVPCQLDDCVSVIHAASDTVSNTITFPSGSQPLYCRVDPGQNTLFVSLYGHDAVVLLDTYTESRGATLSVYDLPRCIGIDETNNKAYVCHAQDVDPKVVVISGYSNGC